MRVWKADVVARNGAIHVIGELLRPPYHHQRTEGAREEKADKMQWALRQIFA